MARRDWRAANAKRSREEPLGCRFCGRSDRPLELAHTIGRQYDERRGAVRWVDPDLVVLLCGPYPAGCHGAQHRFEIDIYPVLKEHERAAAELRLGVGQARRAISGRAWLEADDP
jgi:hypothetical protein